MTTDQNAREAAVREFRKGDGIGLPRRISAAIDAYLAALPLPDDAARVVERLGSGLNTTPQELLRVRNKCEKDGDINLWARWVQMVIDYARDSLVARADAAAYIRSQAAALAQMTREMDDLAAAIDADPGQPWRWWRDKALKVANKADRAEAAESSLATVTAERDRLREALKPFSVMAGELFARNWNRSDTAMILGNPNDQPHRLTAGNFFEARLALTGGDGGK